MNVVEKRKFLYIKIDSDDDFQCGDYRYGKKQEFDTDDKIEMILSKLPYHLTEMNEDYKKRHRSLNEILSELSSVKKRKYIKRKILRCNYGYHLNLGNQSMDIKILELEIVKINGKEYVINELKL